MKYLITENRLVDFVDKYLKDTVGELNAREDDFELVDDNSWKVFVYLDYHLEVDDELFDKTKDLFNLSTRETEKLFEKWFEQNYPGNLVISAFRAME